MRSGWIVSGVGHVGVVMMTLLTWQTTQEFLPTSGAVVPVEVVDIAAESNVRPLSEFEAMEEELPEAADEAREEALPEPSPAPEPRPSRRQPDDNFDLAAIAGMINREDTQPRRRQEGERADRTQQGAGAGTANVAAMEDRVRALAQAHISRNQCWRMPIDLPNPETLVVTVQFDLNRNGTLRGQPRVTSPSNYTFNPAMRTAAESALRAIRLCDPWPFADDPVVGDHYEVWREMEYVFRPSL